MTAFDSLDPAAAIADLSSTTHPLDDLATLPAAPGLYAWWTSPEILPHLPGPAHPHEALRLLYVGIASDLRRRIISNQLQRSRSSTLRRTAHHRWPAIRRARLLHRAYRPRRTQSPKTRPGSQTGYTPTFACPGARIPPHCGRPAAIGRLAPPLNLDHASVAIRDIVKGWGGCSHASSRLIRRGSGQ